MSFLYFYPSSFLVLLLSLSFTYIFYKNKQISSLLLACTFSLIGLVSISATHINILEMEQFQTIESVIFGLGLFLYLSQLLKRNFFRKDLEKVQNRVFLKLPLLGAMVFYALNQHFSVAQLYVFYWGGFVLLFPLVFKLKVGKDFKKSYLVFIFFISISHFSRLFLEQGNFVYNAFITISWLIGLFFLLTSSSQLESFDEK